MFLPSGYKFFLIDTKLIQRMNAMHHGLRVDILQFCYTQFYIASLYCRTIMKFRFGVSCFCGWPVKIKESSSVKLGS